MDGDSLVPIGKWFRFNPDLGYKETTVVEIGAYDYEFADIIIEHWPCSEYHIFEADWKNFGILQGLGHDPCVYLHNAAIAEHSGTIQFHRYNTQSASSLFKPDAIERARHKVIETQEVQAVTMQDILDITGNIDLLLLNCEGGELYALRPLFDMRLAQRIRQIGVSFHALQKIYPYKTMTYIMERIQDNYSVVTIDERRGYYHLTLKD